METEAQKQVLGLSAICPDGKAILSNSKEEDHCAVRRQRSSINLAYQGWCLSSVCKALVSVSRESLRVVGGRGREREKHVLLYIKCTQTYNFLKISRFLRHRGG